MQLKEKPSKTAKGAKAVQGGRPCDVFVAFGITGDLAKQMTLRALYKLEGRGLLNCPIVGAAVDDWTAQDLRRRAQEAIVAGGGELGREGFERFAKRLRYVRGGFTDPATYTRLGQGM